jgi:hypothetical protein
MYLQTPTVVTTKGSSKKTYPTYGDLIYCNFRTFGGTEVKSNDMLSIENTAVIETWYRPDIKADCRLKSIDGTLYEILGTPENIYLQNQYLKFKVRAIKGGA